MNNNELGKVYDKNVLGATIEYTIKCNEFHRILYSAIDFMLKDKRVE